MFTPVPGASIRQWILPRPKKHATGMFFAPTTQRPASSNPYSLAKRHPPQRGGFLFVSLAHFRYHQKTPQPIMYIRQHSFGMQPDAHGFSHGLKTCHRHVFLTAFRVPSLHQKKRDLTASLFLVREMGLEPTRRNHTHLKRACLPFQHSRKCAPVL